ncbi:histone deacetylase [Alienimonas sp. DA493]|uniref:histone deacetylase family protein n=1 Tax=Alienimonas sp. DA493 TaxID=3373605 RepID=UPI0037547B8C
MAKYTRLRERVAAWLEEDRPPGAALKRPPAATDEQLLRAHTPDYLRRITTGDLTRPEVNRLGFPWSEALVERSRRSVGATIAACTDALAGRGAGRPFAANLAGGTHHAFADRGEGFCLFNDAVVALRDLRARGLIERAAIVDCDVHQGNGTAALCADDPLTFTLSLHGARNYPGKKETSDLDVPLPDGTGDDAYLWALGKALEELDRRFAPQLIVYVAGADPYEHDRLGRLGLSAEGLRERDRTVYRWAKERGLPVAAVMAGGYAPDVEAIAGIHFATVRSGFETLCEATGSA